MIKPEDLTSEAEITALEEAVDNQITVEYNKNPTGPYTLYTGNLPEFTAAAWHILKPRYLQHWKIIDHLEKNAYKPYIQFSRQDQEVSMIGRTFQGDK